MINTYERHHFNYVHFILVSAGTRKKHEKELRCEFTRVNSNKDQVSTKGTDPTCETRGTW